MKGQFKNFPKEAKILITANAIGVAIGFILIILYIYIYVDSCLFGRPCDSTWLVPHLLFLISFIFTIFGIITGKYLLKLKKLGRILFIFMTGFLSIGFLSILFIILSFFFFYLFILFLIPHLLLFLYALRSKKIYNIFDK